MIREWQVEVGGKPLYIQHGLLAEQANGAVTVRQGDTVVLVTACMAEAREGIDFFPLTVDYEERLYAAGRVPGSFPRRETRPSPEAILTMRLTDRPLRPLFPKGFRNEVQIIAMTLSADREHQPDTLITVGASAALMISDIPFNGPVSSVRVTLLNGEYIINPTFQQADEGLLDIVVAGTQDAVVMVEAGAKECSEDQVIEAIERAMEANRAINEIQLQMAREIGRPKKPYAPAEEPEEAIAAVAEYLKDRMDEVMATATSERSDANKALRLELMEVFGERFTPTEIADALWNVIKREMRRRILEEGRRADGRGLKDIRPLDIKVGVLPRTHGSGLFQRGQTQVLTIATLANLGMAQKLDTLSPDESKRFMHHYNFPPFSVGEVRPLRGAGRREIGHGALAERALEPVIPPEEEFPYVLRLVSETMSSNGSTSMASVCGGTLALMDAGVPIREPVAGIAMGLVMGENGEYRILTDIAGQEDFMGDMDFKVAGTKNGITALQMDIKVPGVSSQLLREALEQAREARLYILERMLEVIPAPRPQLSPYAPKMQRITINPDLIGLVIGPGGKMVRRIQELSGGTTIDIEEDGTIYVSGIDPESVKKAVEMIEALTKEVKVGEVYTGKVTRLLNFGAFVEILPGKEALVHISDLAPHRVNRVEDVVKPGDEITVMVTEIDSLGRINASRKALMGPETEEEAREAVVAAAKAREAEGGSERGKGGGGRRRRERPRGERGGGDRRGGGSRGGGSRGSGSGQSAPRGQQFGGATRGWTRRTGPNEGPPQPPPPPRPGLGGAGSYDD